MKITAESACVIGGGFYGVVIALFLKRVKRVESVDIYEQGSSLLSRASFVNQARVHNGYHYPRSFTTAYRSRENFQRFCSDWNDCVKSDFRKYYALARRNSKVTPHQFRKFCVQIGAPLSRAEAEITQLFNPALIEAVYKVEEYAFDSVRLRAWAERELRASGISCHFGRQIINASTGTENSVQITMRDGSGILEKMSYSIAINCTYSGLSQVEGNQGLGRNHLKHEIAELALIEPPLELEGIGVTVMDGPFFSTMPFPARGCHSLSHVRYTPHSFWVDRYGLNPYDVLNQSTLETRVDRMIRDASRYLPVLAKSKYRGSLFEVKTILEKNESDDGRPILFRESTSTSRLYSVLGGKIDNVYDILEELDKHI